MGGHEEALRKLEDAAAIQNELLDPDDGYGRIAAELRDAMLAFDRAAYERAEEEAEASSRTYRRLSALWLQAKEARDAGHDERLPETAAAIRYIAEADFRRREQRSDNPKPQL